MVRRITVVWLQPILVLTLVLALGFASDVVGGKAAPALPRQSSPGVSLSVKELTGPPGAEVVLPVTLSAPEALKIGEIKIRVGFQKSLLTFVKMELGGLATAGGATLQTQVRPGSDDSSAVDITLSTSAAASPRQTLAAGEIGRIVFRIGKTAKPNSWIPLSLAVTASSVDDPPSPITPVTAYRTRVGVAVPPAIGCFFYMH